MRRLSVSTFVTLDGVMQAPGGPDEDPTGGFTEGGWQVGYWDDKMGEVMGAAMAEPKDLLLGRKTYEIFAAHWPFAGEDDPTAAAMNNATKYVASRTLTSLDWQNSVLLEGDVAQAIARLKESDGREIQVVGSSNLVQTLLKNRLVDEFSIWIHPVVVGKGKRLFEEGAPPFGLELVDSQVSTTGVFMNTYRPAGEIKKGSFALEEPTELELERRENLE